MTAFTPVYQLPYPTGTDKPCDGAAQITALRDAIYDELDRIIGRVDLQTELPMVAVAWSGPNAQVIPYQGSALSAPIVYDTVEQDDFDGAADLITRNNAIVLGKTPEATGMFIVGFNFSANTARGWIANIQGAFTTTDLADYDIGSGWDENPPYTPYLGGNALMIVQGETSVEIKLDQRQGFTDVNLTTARLWAVRVGDGF